MARLETVIKEAIARGAQRQVRAAVAPLRRDAVRLRRKVGELQRTVTALRRRAAGWERLMKSAPPVPPVSEEEARAARLSPRLIRSLRKRLGLNQTTLARVVGVSAPAVARWEGGGSAPAGRNRATLVGLRKVGRRAVKELLARNAKAPASRPRRARRRTARPRRKAGR